MLLQPKLLVLWKNFPAQQSFKIVRKIHFLALEVTQTTSRWFFGKKSKKKFLDFLKFFNCGMVFFSSTHFASAWKSIFFSFFESTIPKLSPAFSRTKKSLKQIILERNEYLWFWAKKQIKNLKIRKILKKRNF